MFNYCLKFAIFLAIVNVTSQDEAVTRTKRGVSEFEGHKKLSTYSVKNHFGNYDRRGNCNYPTAPANGQITCPGATQCYATCDRYYQFPNGEVRLLLVCEDAKWKTLFTKRSISDCQPICLPQCLNNGICIGPNQCSCSDPFSGPQCQFKAKPCLNLPAPVQNSGRRCNAKTCTVSCMAGFTFPDGSSIANLNCIQGTWLPTRTDWPFIPDCNPVCSPPCQNGGICLALNTCQCPQDFRGRECQFHADRCNIKSLGFNGGYKCHGDTDMYSCVLNCPEGVDFSSPPADKYICEYKTGVFQPQPVPRCEPRSGVEIITLGASKNSYMKTISHFWKVEGAESESAAYNQTDKNNDFQTVSEGEFKSVKGGHYDLQQVHEPSPNDTSEMELQTPAPKTCFTWGGSHYKTFDGAIYSFSSRCPYILLQETRDGLVTIIVQNSPGCTDKGRCHKIIKIYAEKKEFFITLNEDGLPTFKTAKKILPIPAQLIGIRVQMSGQFVVVSLDSIGASLKWDGGLFIQVMASESLWNRTAGLCGRMNGVVKDDRTGREGNHHQIVSTFAADWKAENVGEKCDDYQHIEHSCAIDPVLREKAEVFCNEIFSDEKFRDCSKRVDLESLKATCEWDFCGCEEENRKACACNTMSVYVRQCFHDGIANSLAWRKEGSCTMKCNGGKVYKSCGPKFQPSCNDDAVLMERIDELECEEGCFCPEGTVLHDGNCISVEECPCRLRGKIFQPDATISKQCNTCTCSAGKWVCTQVRCGARCAAVGDPHYVTFDGKHYDFMGKCGYYLVKGENYSIEAENVACSGAISETMGFSRDNSPELPSCTKSVTIRFPFTTISLKQDRQITVDDKDVRTLPISFSDIKIRLASSIFIVVNLPNGLEVWWDGVSRVYVNAPADLRGQTKGLCGTFTENQRTDFLTPFGDIEQSVVDFANKWKTSELCDDVSQKGFSHPCDANPERLATAENYCSKIWSNLFKSCHWHVDPDIFYKDCKYDMCACNGKVSNCLCPTLSAYAKECAINDVKIPWRAEVEECQLHCPPGQEYQICGNSCTRTCDDIVFNEDCRQECVEGCNCPEDQALNTHGECIPIGQCPCTSNGIEFHTGDKQIRAGTKSEQLCTCVGALWNCKDATVEEVEKYSPATGNILCSASRNQESTTCEPVEPRTCRNMHQPINQTPAICRPGCICKEGYVLDSVTGECLQKENCPCYHGGRSYIDNSTMQEECNTCQCKGGHWKCTERICSGVCSAWGDSHFTTFDDRTYDFQGICDYVLVKSSFGADDCFEVAIQNVPCGSSGVSCSKSVTLSVGNRSNQERVTLTRGKALPKENFNRIMQREAGHFVFLDVPDLGLTLQWDRGTRVYVKLEPKWKGRTKGLCGDYNDNSEDDFKTPSGGIPEVSANIFGDSWKKDNNCPEPKDITDTCVLHPERRTWAIEKCGVLKSSLFEACHSEVNIEPYVDRCIFDTCGCDGGGDCECLCTSLAAYAHQCNRRGVPVKWRSQELCPMQCDEDCSSYSPCISTCPMETCDDLSHLRNESRQCVEDICIDGCSIKACPEGQIWKNSSFQDCVPRMECRPVCLVKSEVTYYEGDTVSSDPCQTCFCSRGKLICNGAPCTAGVEPMIIPMNEPEKCVSGWSEWLNNYSPKHKRSKTPIKGKIKSSKQVIRDSMDIEPLPTMIDLLSLNNSNRCPVNRMVNIRCRTVDGHREAKETGLDVECSLERGLYCTPAEDGICPDFEISVYCQCEDTPKSPTTTTFKPVPNPPKDECDLNSTSFSILDCSIFYECAQAPTGNKLIKKTCGSTMYYNTQSKTCDWPQSVALIRSECGAGSHTKAPGLCKQGHTSVDCAIDCSKTCDVFHHLLTDEKLCGNGTECIPGCVADGHYCPPNKVLRDAVTCVEPQDCPCRSHNGTSIKPGIVVRESDCEVCQCVNNYYSCDTSACQEVRTSAPPVNTTAPTRKLDELITIVPSTVTPPEPCTTGAFESLPGSIVHTWPNNSLWKSSLEQYWEPPVEDNAQQLEIELQRMEVVYGLIVQGNLNENKFVTNYAVLFSPAGDTFSYLPEDFKGPIDAVLPVKQIFHQPIEAKFLRINPKSWMGGISMRVDVLGCREVSEPPVAQTTPIYEVTTQKPICDDPMGLDNGLLLEAQVTVSSYVDPRIQNLRLSSPNIWRPNLDNPHQFVQFDFRENRNLTGVKTKGADNIWTTAYRVYYSSSPRDWNPIIDSQGAEKVFLGNFDDLTSKTNYFDAPISARYLKIQPIKWHGHVGMKVEVHGCFLPYPPSPPKIQQTRCNVCNGIDVSTNQECPCQEPLFWDGMTCIDKRSCPCIVQGTSYQVGSTYETSDCDKCTCTLGGIPECHKKVCEPCEDPTMKYHVTELCGCVCKPCPHGQRLCRTSNICINEALWCNGVKDCADDESGCPIQLPDIFQEIYNETITITNTTAERNVTTISTCEIPTCPPNFKLVPRKELSRPSRPPPPFFGGKKKMQSRIRDFHSTKGVKEYHRNGKQPRRNDLKIQEVEGECKEFSCVPTEAPPISTARKGADSCPAPQCPSNHRIIFEPQSMYNPIPCPRWRCQPPREEDAICHIDGKIFSTFDKMEYKYDICNHMLARDMYFNKWYITLENHCDMFEKSCTKVIAIVLDADVIVLYPNRSIEINEYTFTPQQIKNYQDRTGEFKIFLVGNKINFSSRKYGFFVAFNEASICIGVNPRLKGRVDGLCGYYDGNMKNDKQTPTGLQAKTTQVFGDSWVMDGTPECDTQGCSKEMYVQAKEICSAINDKLFQPCGSILSMKSSFSKCVESACMCINSNMTADECKCRSLSSFVTDCQAAAENIDLFTWRDMYNCSIQCSAPLVYNDCFRNKCEASCENLQEIEPCPPMHGVCFPGCFCPDGLVRRGEECVAPTDCRDCVCNGFGNSQFMTFDKKDLTFAGNCTYILSQDIIKPPTTSFGSVKGGRTTEVSENQQVDHTYQVLMTNVPCEKGVCTETLAVIYKGHFLEVKRDTNRAATLITLDGSPLESFPFKSPWLQIEYILQKDLKILILPIKLDLTIYNHNFAFNLRLPSHIFGEAIEGLCGNCNANPEDDLRKASGEITEEVDDFGMSWLATGLPTSRVLDETACTSQPPKLCEPPAPETDVCMALLDPETFGQCHRLVHPIAYVDSCHNTLCEKGDTCADLERYAEACREAGFCPNWRRSNLCPFTCTGDLVYQSCGSSCQDTCETVNSVHKPACLYKLSEGCFCPTGQLMHNHTCIPEKQCFACDDEGHIEGDVWHPQKCTTCSCTHNHVRCMSIDCPSVNIICQENHTPMLIKTSSDECCAKYQCAPLPTVAPSCSEAQVIECAYGQIMRLSKDINGCPKFICECLPPEDCPPMKDELTNDVEILGVGYVQFVNTSGCCPRKESYCNRESCPLPSCPEYYIVKSVVHPGACCPSYECESPKDRCLYRSNSLGGPIKPVAGAKDLMIPKEIGDTWSDGLCLQCTCQITEGSPLINCTSPNCETLESHADYRDYVLELKEADQCCPQFERIACKGTDEVHVTGSVWQLNESNACLLAKCDNTTNGIQKTIITQECSMKCDQGYLYRPSEDSGVKCCGECVPIACMFEGSLKNISEQWQSIDFCTNYTCLLENNTLRVKESVILCSPIDLTEEENYEIIWERAPGECCSTPRRNGCKMDGDVHQIGESWRSSKDNCLTFACSLDGKRIELEQTRRSCNETCDLGWEYQMPADEECCGTCKQTHCIEKGIPHERETAWNSTDMCLKFECKDSSDGLMIKEIHQKCNDNCDFGWKYQDPVAGECCGRCKQIHCIDNGTLHNAGDIWKAADPCWTHECKNIEDQFIMISSGPSCPDIQDCPEESIYSDGCCKKCRSKIESQVECAAEVLEPSSTIAKIREYKDNEVCVNKKEIPGYTECRGACKSEIRFDPIDWHQQSVCHCCQPLSFKQIVVELECSDGRAATRKISVPISCTCKGCSSSKLSEHPSKGKIKG